MTWLEVHDLPADVIARALEGEADAFRRFYECYDPTVRWAVGMRILRWPQLVPLLEDIVQEVWLELLRGSGRRLRYHDPSRGVPFHRFLGLVSMRYGWRIAKRELGHPTTELVDLVEDDEDAFPTALLHADLLQRLAERVDMSLSPEDRQLFDGYYVQGDALKVVGARMGLNENATYKRRERLHRKLQALADELLGQPRATSTAPAVAALVVGVLCVLARGGAGGIA